jgi:type IV pilus assembly protein PilZ
MSEPVERQPLPLEIKTTVERRKTPRTPVVVRVTYCNVDVLFSEFARNINEGGLFIETENPPALDTHVSLQFELPGSEEPIQTEGRVVWISSGEDEEPPGMGVGFEGLSPEARTRINELVRRLRRDPRAG